MLRGNDIQCQILIYVRSCAHQNDSKFNFFFLFLLLLLVVLLMNRLNTVSLPVFRLMVLACLFCSSALDIIVYWFDSMILTTTCFVRSIHFVISVFLSFLFVFYHFVEIKFWFWFFFFFFTINTFTILLDWNAPKVTALE